MEKCVLLERVCIMNMMFLSCLNIVSDMSSAERLLSYNLLSLITSTPLAGAAMSNTDENDDEDSESPSSRKSKLKGLTNHDGAWCWKEECDGNVYFKGIVIKSLTDVLLRKIA